MKRTIAILLTLTFFSHAFAGIGDKVIVYPKKEKAATDTVPYVVDEEELMGVNDSLSSFPGYGLYSAFDTSSIHYTKFDVTTLRNNTKEILLNEPYSCGYVAPVTGKITSSFGPRKRRYHYGTDIGLQTGDAVGAAFDGKVRIAQKNSTYGNVIVIRHNNGLETYYAHLSKINVEVGQEVSAGQIIGLGGNTGRSHGSHLHFEVRYLGQPINPTDIISFTENKLLSDTLTLSEKTFSYIAAKKTKTSTGTKTSTNTKTKPKTTVKKTPVTKPGTAPKEYVVKKGDTLYGIASRYGMSTQTICQKNGLKTSSTLHLGQKIKL